MIAAYAQPRFAPLPAPRRADWVSIAAQLHARPGEWAAVAESTLPGHPVNARQRRTLGIECQVRSNGDGTHTIWMRSMVEPSTAERAGVLALVNRLIGAAA